MKSLQHSILWLLSVLASLLPAAAQERKYSVISVDVPFKFTAGERTFRPGHYALILAGPGLMAICDDHRRVVASLITRASDEATPSPNTRLVFDRNKKKPRLEKVYLENHVQVLEVLEEQLAIRSTPPPAPSLLDIFPLGTLGFRPTTDGLARMKQ